MSELPATIDQTLGRVTLAELLGALLGQNDAPTATPVLPPSADPAPVATGAVETEDAGDGPGVVIKHDFFKADRELNSRLKAAGLSDAQVQLVYDIAEERLVPIVRDLGRRYRSARDLDRLVERFGGEERWREVARQIKAWAERNLPTDAVDTLTSSHDGVMAIHRMMTGAEPSIPRGGPAVGGASGEDDLRAMIRDPKYWRDRDPSVIARVTDGFRRLYPNG